MSYFIASEHRTARKEHHCSTCNRTIRVGEKYRRGCALYDYGGGFYDWKDCAHCEALMMGAAFDAWEADEGYNEETVDYWGPTSVADLRLKVQFKRRWARRDGTLYPVPEKRVSA